jgi:hypothetical protein
MSDVKKQHFVPQFYLRKFADSNSQLFVFDKFTKQPFKANVSNVASESRFYDFHQDIQKEFQEKVARGEAILEEDAEIIQKALDPQLVEKELANIEGDFVNVLDEMLETIDKTKGIDPEHKLITAYFMAVQILRTPEFRRTLIELQEQTMAMMLEKWYDQHVAENNLYIKFDERYASLEHAQFLFSPRLRESIFQTLSEHIWIVGINRTTQPLYTSDTPVVKKAHIKDPYKSYAGLGSLGIEIAFPISPKYVLILCERTAFLHYGPRECGSLSLNLDNITHYNSLQVLQSYRQVYCSSQKFGLAEQICNEHPEVCTPNRKRFEIG